MYLFLSVAVVLLWVLICLFYNGDENQVFIKRERKDDSTLLSVFLICHPRWIPCSEGFPERTPLGPGK